MASTPPMFSALLLGFLLLLSAAAASDRDAGAKEMHLHFYFRETYQGPGQSTFDLVSLSNTSFGTVRVSDNPILEGPEESSALIGRLQGTATVASLSAEKSLHTSLDIAFTAGEFNGSTLSLVGKADPTASSIERPVVGGTGQFRLARGVIVSRIIGSSSTYIIVENDVYLSLPRPNIVDFPIKNPQKTIDVDVQ